MVAARLSRARIHPNTISVAGAGFAAIAGACLFFAGRSPLDWRFSGLLVLGVAGMQSRLLCNLFDGMNNSRSKAG